MAEPSEFKIEYGLNDKYFDITQHVLRYHTIKNIIKIPTDDSVRAWLFGDPLVGIVKHIKITYNGQTTTYSDKEEINLDISGFKID